MGAMVARPVTGEQLRAAVSRSGPDRLFELDWAAHPSISLEPVSVHWWGRSDTDEAGEPAESAVAAYVFESASADALPGVYAATHAALTVLQSWLTGERAGVLVVITRGAIALPGEDVTDLAGPRCGGWCGRRKPSIRAGWCWPTWTARSTTPQWRRSWRREPQVCLRGGVVQIPRVHGCRAVAGLLVPPTDRPWRLGLTSAGTFENLTLEPIPKPTRSYSRVRSGSPHKPSPRTSVTS
ncbi:phenolphthiocerol synthesis polyketide synthase type I Pks15/1 domain protein [Mycobacterium xenopi 4042]|uniref:Phenolphthiocerol synthesis polyketide synthase type I Pks15/1 domain protein n=1 Tax=Mycobacterium xenopi 4042 TaxID=1299334 RepID=X8BGA3_MYCXE|nr:phenolphthiocerol synthesis polyketide synthase type I Pks15/1 domain protein [Mycobacterium xenopi 4042]